jgi:hypothetical protein
MPDEPDTTAPAPPVHLLHCLTCGVSIECRPGDVLRFTRTGWPQCCGGAMTLYAPVERPTPREQPGID